MRRELFLGLEMEFSVSSLAWRQHYYIDKKLLKLALFACRQLCLGLAAHPSNRELAIRAAIGVREPKRLL